MLEVGGLTAPARWVPGEGTGVGVGVGVAGDLDFWNSNQYNPGDSACIPLPSSHWLRVQALEPD